MNAHHPVAVANLFPSRAVLDTLGVLFSEPDREFYQTEIVDRLFHTKLQIQRALKRIHEAGLLELRQEGRRVYYRAARENPIFHEIQSLVFKTVGLPQQLRIAFQDVANEVVLLFIFGSVANGTDGARSDLDLFCVGNVSSRRLSSVVAPFGRELGREINCVHFTPDDFMAKIHSRNPFVQKVLSDTKLWVIGSEDELAEMVG